MLACPMRPISSRVLAPVIAAKWLPVWRRSWMWMPANPAPSRAPAHIDEKFGRRGVAPFEPTKHTSVLTRLGVGGPSACLPHLAVPETPLLRADVLALACSREEVVRSVTWTRRQPIYPALPRSLRSLLVMMGFSFCLIGVVIVATPAERERWPTLDWA